MILKSIFIFICSLFINQTIWAKNIVLLSSLPQKDESATIEIKKQFFKKLSDIAHHGNNLIYINKATTHHLYQYLNDPETMALFWISHGGHAKIKNNNSGIGATSILIDFDKVNVAKIFQKVHPNIKYLGILGCNSWQIVKDHFDKRDDLGYYIPSRSIVATWSFRVALKKFKRHYWKKKYSYLDHPILMDGYPITITRNVSSAAKALMVFAGKKLIGIFEPTNNSQIQTKTFYIPDQPNIKNYDFKIILKSGQLGLNKDDFGTIEVSQDNHHFWKLFAKSDGTPFGINERIFVFKNNIQNLKIEQDVIDFTSDQF